RGARSLPPLPGRRALESGGAAAGPDRRLRPGGAAPGTRAPGAPVVLRAGGIPRRRSGEDGRIARGPACPRHDRRSRSPGERRGGLRGRPFVFLKFRAMRVGSDATIHRDYTSDWIYGRTGGAPDGPAPRSVGAAARAGAGGGVEAGVHKIVNDPRVTLVGR